MAVVIENGRDGGATPVPLAGVQALPASASKACTPVCLVPTRCVGMQSRRAAPRVAGNVSKCGVYRRRTQRVPYRVPTQRVGTRALPVSRSWSFGYRVPKQELGNPRKPA